MPLEPAVLFFVVGFLAGVARTDLRLPAPIYDAITIFLLLAIGLKGGVELARYEFLSVLGPALVATLAGVAIPLTGYPVLRRLGHFAKEDAASIAAHYGSVSVVTFAVGGTYLASRGQAVEGYMTVILVLLEVPALLIGVLLARGGDPSTPWGRLVREVVMGKAFVLLLGGLVIGWIAGPEGIRPLDNLFFDLFKGVLAIFLLEMGLVAAQRSADLRRVGPFLIVFGIAMPIVSSLGGLAVGLVLKLSAADTAILSTLYASASYIAAPAAMRIAVPKANPTLSLGASLGVTFPFNILLGIPLYDWMARMVIGT